MPLAALSCPPERSRGRRRPEPAHPYRNAYQRDRDRIVHSRAFRRLEHKTQVFTSPLSDHFRDRLTHSIEVAQIARTAARALGLDEDLTEALALGHDLGHPPFGHAGEQILAEEMARFGETFDHNVHALRVVDRFERRYAAHRGLNLTFEVREGLLKHSRDYEPGDAPEADELLPGLRPPLEAQLIDPADEIAYNCADLDDAVEAKALEVEEARERVPGFGDMLDEVARRHPDARGWRLFNEALRLLIDSLVTALIEGAVENARRAGVETLDDVRRSPDRLARLAPEAAARSKALKALLTERVYRSAALEREAIRAAEKARAVFRHYLEHSDELPRASREEAEAAPLPRIVCDYVAGMTDKFLLRRYEELFGAGEP